MRNWFGVGLLAAMVETQDSFDDDVSNEIYWKINFRD